MNSTERAARLRLVDDEADRVYAEEKAAQAARKYGSWRWTRIADELHFRSKALPTMQLDLLRPEARDLMLALAKALSEPAPATPRVSWAARFWAWLGRRAWNKRHEWERAEALRRMADELRETGGW